MNMYRKRILDARNKFLKLNKKQEKELLKLYQQLAEELVNDIILCKTSYKYKYLKNLNDMVQVYVNELSVELNNIINNNIKISSEIASSTSLAYYDSITDNLKLKNTFNRMVKNISNNTVKKLIQGNYYADGKTLDNRIWNINKKNAKDIDTLIKVNISKGANSRELAKCVDKYINPLKRFDAKTIISGMNKNVSYQAQRLARTSITHSFAETTIENAKNNPFNIGLKWNLSSSHHVHDICDDYSGKVFQPKDVPLQHCNCICYLTEENISIDSAVKQLKDWINSGENKKLDKWIREFGEEFM